MQAIPSSADIAAAAAALQRGELVAFPTETVYGLGADASNTAAVANIFAAKGRPADHPLIVHVAAVTQLNAWVQHIPESAQRLAQQFWPGPLTIVLPRAATVNTVVTGGQDTIAIRIPAHPVAQALLSAVGGGIAAPAANRFGRISATTAAHVRQEFGDALACVLDGGAADVGIESTIVDCSRRVPVLLRPGVITALQLEAALGQALGYADATAPRAPGMLDKHYAPMTPMKMMEADLLVELAHSLTRQGQRVAVLAREARSPMNPQLVWLNGALDAIAYAHDLYAHLRQLDAAQCDVLLVEQPPQDMAWFAVMDRLQRAAAGAGHL